MNTDKEITAFVGRMVKRLNDSPKGSRRGRHRAAFIAVRPLIEGALLRGHTLKATWEALREEGKLSMTYESFRRYCRAMGVGSGMPTRSGERVQAHQPKPVGSALVPDAAIASPHGSARPAASAAQSSPPVSNARSFRHERVPRTGKIYG